MFRLLSTRHNNFLWYQQPTEESEEDGAVHDGTQAIRSFHKQLTELPRIGPIQAAHHVNSIGIGGRYFASQVTVYKQELNRLEYQHDPDSCGH